MKFDFDEFVSQVRAAAKEPDPNRAVRGVLEGCVSDPEPIIAATPEDGEDEVNLFEDEALSIWRCRFQPHVVMPPHEHKLTVHIAVYSGGEKNILFQPNDGQLKHENTTVIGPGEVISLEEDCIHAVTADGESPSLALHVYMGPLMKLKRDLFDWNTGEAVDFSMENFHQMKRRASELPNF
ncbi:MAG: hypothetical protein HKN05_15845 [Rhizobiales bacterium]|nr:hypothetical protein [Hyphomicrobiales bacterium]